MRTTVAAKNARLREQARMWLSNYEACRTHEDRVELMFTLDRHEELGVKHALIEGLLVHAHKQRIALDEVSSYLHTPWWRRIFKFTWRDWLRQHVSDTSRSNPLA